MIKLNKIEICWYGPLTVEEVKKDFNDQDKDYGLYQVYGTHNISGPDTLLYIGRTTEQPFASRLSQHQNDWLESEYSNVQVYIGRLGGLENVDDDTWVQQIKNAEGLLIYHCAPPYNSSGLNGYGDIHYTIVINLEKKNRLPLEVSTFYNDSEYWGDKWAEYQTK